MAKRNTILKVSGLKRAFGPVTIVDNFNLEVAAGEAVVLTGRNGAGKSTVLRCLVGADKPSEGTVEVLGEKMNETSAEIRRNVATVIDDLDFFPDLSVVEHLDLLARAHGITDPDEAVDEVLEEVQLVPQSGQLPGTLSSGQRRRLALATAFVRPRKLLVLDEPEQRLDVEGVRWLAERLNSEVRDGLALVFASHEPYLVDQVATRVVQIGEGREQVILDGQTASTAGGSIGGSGGVLNQDAAKAKQTQQQAQQHNKPKPKPKPSHGKKKR